MLSEISQTEKDKYSMVSLICVDSNPKQTNKQTNTHRNIDTENKQVFNRGRWVGTEKK